MSDRLILSDGSSWPRPTLESDEHYGIGHKLRYVPKDLLTYEELLEAAEVISAYGFLVAESTQERRDFVCGEIRQQLAQEGKVMKQINSLAALETLPHGAVIIDRDGDAGVVIDDGRYNETEVSYPALEDSLGLMLVPLPAVLLHPLPEPEYEYGVELREPGEEPAGVLPAPGGAYTTLEEARARKDKLAIPNEVLHIVRRRTAGPWEEVETTDE